MSWKIKLLLYLSLFAAGHMHAMCQISGTINTYTKVTAVNYVCNFITVSSPTGFAAGDKVLLLQMQGATITQTNTVNFGDITAIGDAGNYEFAIIDHFSSNDVYFSNTLLKTYTPAGAVQMISVPQYAAVSVDGELTAKAWDGETGGVIVFESSDVVTLNADINVSEKGFRGGQKSPAGGDCNTSSSSIYYYAYPTVQAGQKGEGIAAYITGKESGRAKNTIGGGGGNSHNTGGGGGGNYGAGGRGGDKKNPGCGFAPNPFGYGSLELSSIYSLPLTKIFMGGGGGGGHQNNFLSFDAGNGGGIVIIKAASLNANGYLIRTNGGSVNTYYTSSLGDNGDGNSGGGAGGTILLNVQNYAVITQVEAYGGKGGNTGYTTYDFGPGGGGGGGLVGVSASPTNKSVLPLITGGSAGISGSGAGNGSGTKWNAADGANGAIFGDASLPQSTTTSNCALPVALLSFTAQSQGKYKVQLNWSTATELNNDFFTLEKSTDGLVFFPLAKLQGKNNSHQITAYTYTDQVSYYDLLYYRLKQTDIDGHTVDLGVRKVYAATAGSVELTVYPNPCGTNVYVQFEKDQQEPIKTIGLINAYGESMLVKAEAIDNGLLIDTSFLPAGLYSLMVYTSSTTYTTKLIKQQ